MADILAESLKELQRLALRESRVLCFYSGGKDSLAALDLCVRVWGNTRVTAVFMYFVPGLAVAEERLDFARKHWGVEVLPVPHWITSTFLHHGFYGVPLPEIVKVKLAAVYAHVRDLTGVHLIACGGKSADGLWRRRQLKKASATDRVVYPVKAWNKWDVLGYLKGRNIPATEKFDLDLGTKNLLWLHDNHPDDFRRVEAYYPFVRAVVCRRDWYGVTG